MDLETIKANFKLKEEHIIRERNLKLRETGAKAAATGNYGSEAYYFFVIDIETSFLKGIIKESILAVRRFKSTTSNSG